MAPKRKRNQDEDELPPDEEGKYVCKRRDENGVLCGAVMKNLRRNIVSHNSDFHPEGDGDSRYQAFNRETKLDCWEGSCDHTSKNFNSVLAHVRRAHGFKGSSDALKAFYGFPTSAEHKKHKEQLAKEKKQQRAREGQQQESQEQGRQTHHQYSNHGTPAYNQPRPSAQNLPSIPEEDIPDNSQYNYSGSNGNAASYSHMTGGTQYRYSQGVVDREHMHSYQRGYNDAATELSHSQNFPSARNLPGNPQSFPVARGQAAHDQRLPLTENDGYYRPDLTNGPVHRSSQQVGTGIDNPPAYPQGPFPSIQEQLAHRRQFPPTGNQPEHAPWYRVADGPNYHQRPAPSNTPTRHSSEHSIWGGNLPTRGPSAQSVSGQPGSSYMSPGPGHRSAFDYPPFRGPGEPGHESLYPQIREQPQPQQEYSYSGNNYTHRTYPHNDYTYDYYPQDHYTRDYTPRDYYPPQNDFTRDHTPRKD
ncbi:hypothetical protein F4777DRAFT_556433 [Nemania sp. FL0916]|nr:hypothetical protein F4777DRAFT_556433 [Nemania sp. FL0916]